MPADQSKARRGLRYAITVFGLLIAGIHATHPTIAIDSITIILVIVAALPWVQPMFKTIELLGVKFELQELKDTVERQTKNLELIEDNTVLPGRAGTRAKLPERTAAEAVPTTEKEDPWDKDPNKGKFGGSPERNGRVLSAEITPVSDERSAGCRVVLSVRSTDPTRTLTGQVIFFLHPSFGQWEKYPVEVQKGVAKDKITSWGAFTVGAVADDGKTTLELDLASVPGGTRKFYRS